MRKRGYEKHRLLARHLIENILYLLQFECFKRTLEITQINIPEVKFSQPFEFLRSYLSLLFLHEEEEPVVEPLHHAALHLAQEHVLERARALHAPRPGLC